MVWTSNPSITMQRPHSTRMTICVGWSLLRSTRSATSTRDMISPVLIVMTRPANAEDLGELLQGFEGSREVRIPHAEIFMADLIGPPHVVIGKADGVEMHLRCNVLVPIEAFAGGALEGRRGPPTQTFEFSERGRHIGRMLHEALVECDGVLHRHARARTQGEMYRAQRVAKQDDIAVGPVLVAGDVRAEPERAITQKLVAAKFGAENLAAEAPAFVFVHSVKASALPRIRIHFDEEGA